MTIELASPETTAPAHPSPAAAEPVVIEPVHPVLFTGDALDAETLERHLRARAQWKLHGLALRVAAAKSRLADLAEAKAMLSAAEDARHHEGVDPEEWLLAELAQVEAAIAEAQEGLRREKARRDARHSRVSPLHVAVSDLHGRLIHERTVLCDRASLQKRGGGVDTGAAERLLHLKKAGLSDEQIAALRHVPTVNPDLERYAARLAETAPQIAALEAWLASERRESDHHHLAGLGIDPALIEAARPVDESEAP
jgi:septal ring factor EnvC (AmiA/AmiB activator)